MPSSKELLKALDGGKFDALFSRLYGSEHIAYQRERYIRAVRAFVDCFGDRKNLYLFSAPGRTEISGNHTDHNHGRVLAASVNLDVIAVASPCSEARIRVQSAGYPMDVVELTDVAVREDEKNRSSSLVRGMAARFLQMKLAVGGFDAYTTSDVLKGSGLSSSAAFEILLGTILNHLFNGGSLSSVELAKAAQYAENVYFGKPSGLMDQMASSVGGIIAIDFADPERPKIKRIDFPFSDCGHHLCIVDTGGNHADLTHEYAAVPAEMRAIARSLGVEYLRETSLPSLIPQIPALRHQHGDRAVLRALHFLRENDRVVRQVEALESGNFEEFKRLVIESGHSSFEYLQNVYAPGDVSCQGLSLALCLAELHLSGRGAWRVHGGGFGGTTQNFVPDDLLVSFRNTMETVFGKGCCHSLMIRPYGGIRIDADVFPNSSHEK